MDPESFFTSFFDNDDDKKANVYLKHSHYFNLWCYLRLNALFHVIYHYFFYNRKACRTSTKFLGLANAFSGGVFIGIGLLHLLPEGQEKFKDDKFFNKYPSAYFLAFLAYSLILYQWPIL